MTRGRARPVVIGIGNYYRSDDAAGILVARAIREQLASSATVIEETGEGAALQERWKGADTVFLVDAVHSGAPPGTIHRFDAVAQEIPRSMFHYSTHAFGLAEAVELCRVLKQLPRRMIIYGIEGKNFCAGLELSAGVPQANIAVAARIVEEIRSLARE